ncbi:Hypothetical protein LEPBI_I2793 [Leptospira biflexa serovar Patoc strain 'Patoc 1 (Paris)']|uniref:Uncharacterized protein n=1 Tax=Leptospira biflexa serovar Patoc (strain Patoc 1 / ATCC 23582 / Paris) TaxID=456481 RepID=B0SNA3_LEPBP|nr:Hypothetical protein LEPBI_I2793 [Leptospira biflexa serovar Patoc strain 'Patoc 1 (Paris)']
MKTDKDSHLRYTKSNLNAINTEESLTQLDSWMKYSKP